MSERTQVDYARWQLTEDRRRVARFRSLLGHRRGRMLVSAHAFLRGSAPLFYRMLADEPALAEGPAGDGWIVGDLLREICGAYRCDTLGEDDDKHLVAFDINDFDDATPGPLRLDVLRLLCSVLLAGSELRLDGRELFGVAWALLEGHGQALFSEAVPPPPPGAVTELIGRVAQRGRSELLARRTETVGEHRRFVRGPRYRDLEPELDAPARLAFADYVRSLGRDPDGKAYHIVDLAQRIAGTGSLGCVRIAVLVRGKGGPSGHWIFDLKEAGAPSSAALLDGRSTTPPTSMLPAERVLHAARALPAQPPRMTGTARLGELSLYGRRLAPQEDRVLLSAIAREELRPLGRYLGALLGAAHKRAAVHPLSPWTIAEQRTLYENASRLAGWLFATYFQYASLDDHAT